MTHINVTEEFTLHGNTVTDIAKHKNPYLKKPEKMLATVQFVNETFASIPTGTGLNYNPELLKKLDTYLLNSDNKDNVYGLTIVKTDDGKFYINNTSDKDNLYIAKYAKFSDNTILEIDQTHDFIWNPETINVLEISKQIKNLKIVVNEGTSQVSAQLFYPNGVFMTDTQSTTLSNYTDLKLFSEISYLEILNKEFTSVEFITSLVIDVNFFTGIELNEFTTKTVDLSSMTKLTSLTIVGMNLKNINSDEISKYIRKFMNISNSVEILFQDNI